MADESAAPKKQRTVRSVAPITLQAAVVRRPVAFPPGTKDSFIAPMLRFPETSWRDQDINGGRFITLCTRSSRGLGFQVHVPDLVLKRDAAPLRNLRPSARATTTTRRPSATSATTTVRTMRTSRRCWTRVRSWPRRTSRPRRGSRRCSPRPSICRSRRRSGRASTSPECMTQFGTPMRQRRLTRTRGLDKFLNANAKNSNCKAICKADLNENWICQRKCQRKCQCIGVCVGICAEAFVCCLLGRLTTWGLARGGATSGDQ